MSTLRQNYWSGDTLTDVAVNGVIWRAQTFTPEISHEIDQVDLYLRKDAAVSGDVTVGIRATSSGEPTGADLCSGTVAGSTIPDSADWITFTFSSPASLTKDVKYAIVLRAVDADNATLQLQYAATGAYGGGSDYSSLDSGGSWSSTETPDWVFKEYGERPATGGIPVDLNYGKKLVAIAANEIWYESSAGTMAELEAANGDLDVTKPLMAVEAFQKIFIVNETNLKVADFVNTKLTVTALTTPPTRGSTVTQATSTATMIVDFVNADKTEIYGYVTSGTFVTTAGYTLSGGSMAPETRVPSAVTSAPHWYDWTVYAGDTTNYGTMPTSSSLISLYRGRIVINDDNRAHAWYMFKVGDPFKILYDFTNDGDLSAITHANAEVGEIGDILTAVIDYKDDLVIFGCANSVWILIGDPLGSGQLARITSSTGIWGARSWCIDDRNNLYFLGEDGIYKMPISESYSPPENISKLTLPNLMSDLDLDKSLHRVVLAFDPVNYGVLISKTLLSDGTNSNYWFDLLTQGFYPEDYPASCGIFSAFYYPATDDTYKKFLIGCNDGYIREFDNSTKSDIDTDDTKEAIDAYFAIVEKLSEDEDTEAKLTWLRGTTAGGASGGDFGDSDSVAFSAFTGKDAETTLEKMKATSDWADATEYAVNDLVIYNDVDYICITAHTSDAGGPPNEEPDTNTTDWAAAAFTTGTWSDSGKQNKDRIRMRGCWFGLKFRNNTEDETFAINHICGNVEKGGKIK